MTFKVGDRVRYVGTYSDNVIGFTGTVIGGDPSNIMGKWDNGKRWVGYYASNLELIPPTSSTATERLERLEALARKIAQFDFYNGMDIQEEARSLVAELTPVDGDLVEARKIAMDEYQPSAWDDDQWKIRVLAGDEDEDRSIRSALAGIRRGRALERGEP